MLRAQTLFKASGLSLEELGQRMGYGGSIARKAAWQFLRRTNDPRLSMLRRFAHAVGISLQELIIEEQPPASQ
jgi:transcriptional regulator with XRE-family HTH domain